MKCSKNVKARLKGPGSRGHALQKVIEDCNHKVLAIPRCQKYLTQEAKRGILKVKGNKELWAPAAQRISEILSHHLATIRCCLNSNHHNCCRNRTSTSAWSTKSNKSLMTTILAGRWCKGTKVRSRLSLKRFRHFQLIRGGRQLHSLF